MILQFITKGSYYFTVNIGKHATVFFKVNNTSIKSFFTLNRSSLFSKKIRILNLPVNRKIIFQKFTTPVFTSIDSVN